MSQNYAIQQRMNFWQITFADLLTLLLCFFVALTAGGMGKVLANSDAKLSKQTGTVIAVDPEKIAGEQSRNQSENLFMNKTLWLTAEMYTADSFELNKKSLIDLNYSLKSEGYEIAGFQLATCDQSLNATKAENWDLSMRRMLGLQRQITDMGVAKELLVSRLLGPACTVLGTNNTEQQHVGKIVAEYKKIVN